MPADNREDLLNLIPAYALDALDDDERAAIESWLAEDSEAQALLADYQAVADHLVALTPLHPAPDHLQADLRQRLAANRRWEAPTRPIRAGLLRGSPRRLTWSMAAAVLLVVVIATALIARFGLSDEAAPSPDPAQLYAQIMAQPQAAQYAVVPGDVNASVSGNLVVSPDGTQAILRVASLPAITADQTFQMWLIDSDGARTSGGLFQATTTHDALYIQVPFEQPISAYKGVGVSLEPAGGSPYPDQPTGPRVLSVPLS